MGSEQSSQTNQTNLIQRQGSLTQGNLRQANSLRRQHTIANPESEDQSTYSENSEFGRPGSTSPGPSICSDSDLPYIPYTVNRPIGADSPKLTNKQIAKGKNTSRKITKQTSLKTVKPTTTHNIVVVKPGIAGPTVDKDPDVLRLQNIPMFLPIMRGTLNLPAVRDPEVLERLDPTPFNNLCLRYQNHLHTCANVVATEQNFITQKIREVDSDINRIIIIATERQKRYAKYAEKLQKVQELSHYLNKCHMLLNQTLESMESLNNTLAIEDRLEPFVWTTG